MTVQTPAEAGAILEELIDRWVTDRFPNINADGRSTMVSTSESVAEAITEAGYVVVPATDVDLLRRQVFRSVVGMSYFAAVLVPLTTGLGFESQLRRSGSPVSVSATVGVISALVLGFVFGSLARAIRMFGNPSRKGARRMQERFQARIALEERQEAERIERSRRKLVDQAAQLERRVRPPQDDA